MRVIKIIDNRVVEAKTVLNSYILKENEIQSDTGEIGQIMQSDGTFITPEPPTPTLEDMKTLKIQEIQTEYGIGLKKGFSSSATGTEYVFAYGQSDREKFMQLAISVLSNMANFPVPIPSKDGEIVLHNQDQYQQLMADINAFGWTMQMKLSTLISQIKAATTVEEVNDLVW